uniref:EsV-1-7 n=1 Tax=Heterosigma akashiwo TaxID=2829 RepID=A0A7S3XZM6_HETAK
MVDVKGKLCERAGCDKRPYYNFEGATPRFCQQHQTEGMINLILARKKKCEHEGCTRVPSFNFHGASKGRFCSQHKEEGMKNIFAACKHAECTKHSSYNFEAGQQPKFCAQHKLQGMVNVKHAAASSEQAQKKEGGMPRRVRRNTRTCEQAGCSKGPTFGFQDEQEGRFCEEHKVNGMVDVKNEVCEHAGCHKAPTFTFKGQWYLRFCARHKLEGMVERAKQDKRQGKRTCKHPGCSTWARGMFCPEHKSKDMGGMKGKQNELVASGQKQAFSDSDSDESMLRKKRRTCEQAGCSAAPLFNFEGEQEGRFCEEHKVNGMVGMKSDEVRSANKARRDLGTVLEGTCPPPPLPPLPPTSSVYEHVGGSSKPASSHVRWASMLVYEEVGLTL